MVGKSWSESNTSRFPGAQPNLRAGPTDSQPRWYLTLGTSANNIAVAGLAGGLTDGVVYLGSTNIL